MTGVEANLAVVDALTALGIPFMLVGSLSRNADGSDRLGLRQLLV